MSILKTLAACSIGALTLGVGGAQAQGQKFVTIGTGGVTGGITRSAARSAGS
jgi:TRAP-type uncharacterized transport system substrate-binding protein